MTISFSKFIFGLIFFLISSLVKAQSNFAIFTEPDISINIEQPNRWSFNFGIANRDLVYFKNEVQFKGRFLELSHFTSYEVGFYGKVSLGLRYRFNELFEYSSKDEIRLTQQYSRSRKYNAIKVAHRFRFEQRFRDITVYRTRYQFSIELPLSGERVDQKEYFLGMNTEALLSLTSKAKPAYGQRFGVSIGKEIAKGTKADIGTEYRLSNYTRNTVQGLYIIGGLSLSI